MIIKSLSRKTSSGTRQLFTYLFRYMLDEKKEDLPLSKNLVPLIEEAKRHLTKAAFEKALQKNGILRYHGTPVDFSGTPNVASSLYGNLGNGFYLAHTPAYAKKYACSKGVVKKYVLDRNAKLFDAGKGHAKYLALWSKMSSAKKGEAFVSVAEVHKKIREHLESKGYAGIKTSRQTVLFDAKAITELPKDFYKQARSKKMQEKMVAVPKGSQEVTREKQFVYTWNVASHSIDGYAKEYEHNESLRINKRKNAVQVYHTILSFSNKDKEHISNQLLEEVSKKFVELRGPDNLYVFVSHRNVDHVHLHCTVSGTKISGLSSRQSRQEFSALKVSMDAWQRAAHPELVHSLPRHGSKAKGISREAVVENIKNERSKDKQILIGCLDEISAKTASTKQFISTLKEHGFTAYYRSGKLTGVQSMNGIKFRFSRIGVDIERLNQLDIKQATEEKQLQEIKDIRNKDIQTRRLREQGC